jgi:hypothetical protein
MASPENWRNFWRQAVSHLSIITYDDNQKTKGYCWPTPKCQNLCVQHAFLEGKKAEETSPRRSTSRTLKWVGQQYPGVFW